MKIKTKKEMNLPQLIEWGFKNDIREKSFIAYECVEDQRHEVHFNALGIPKFSAFIKKSNTFTVEIEEEITEDTKLYLVERYISGYEDFKLKYTSHQNRSIKSILENNQPHLKTTHFYTEVDNELILIWKNGKLVE